MIAEGEILFLASLLARHPSQIKVNKMGDDPMTFEIMACKDDLQQIMLREKVIRLMAGASGLIGIKLNFKEICVTDS